MTGKQRQILLRWEALHEMLSDYDEYVRLGNSLECAQELVHIRSVLRRLDTRIYQLKGA